MNKQLFINGFVERILQHYGLSAGHAFEVLVLAAVLDLSFDEALASASTLVKGSSSHDACMDGHYLDEDEHECILHVFQVKSSKNLGDNELSKFVNDYRNLFVYDNSTGLLLNDRVQAVEDETALLQTRQLKYSHNAYFKSAKSRYDVSQSTGAGGG